MHHRIWYEWFCFKEKIYFWYLGKKEQQKEALCFLFHWLRLLGGLMSSQWCVMTFYSSQSVKMLTSEMLMRFHGKHKESYCHLKWPCWHFLWNVGELGHSDVWQYVTYSAYTQEALLNVFIAITYVYLKKKKTVKWLFPSEYNVFFPEIKTFS